MSFKNDKYEIVERAISEEMASFIYRYFIMKRQTYLHMKDTQYLSPYDDTLGFWTDEQIPGTYNSYCDLAVETLAQQMIPTLLEVTGYKLHHQYTYTRIYKYGDILHRHKDRPSCEISCTLNLGGDEWPIWLDPTGGKNNKGISYVLKPGDLLIYRGCELEHWREPFTGDRVVQAFLHYNDLEGPFKKLCNMHDKKPLPALPSWFQVEQPER